MQITNLDVLKDDYEQQGFVVVNELFEKVKLGKIKVEISKKYDLEDAVQAHKDLEGRKIIGPAIIIP